MQNLHLIPTEPIWFFQHKQLPQQLHQQTLNQAKSKLIKEKKIIPSWQKIHQASTPIQSDDGLAKKMQNQEA